MIIGLLLMQVSPSEFVWDQLRQYHDNGLVSENVFERVREAVLFRYFLEPRQFSLLKQLIGKIFKGLQLPKELNNADFLVQLENDLFPEQDFRGHALAVMKQPETNLESLMELAKLSYSDEVAVLMLEKIETLDSCFSASEGLAVAKFIFDKTPENQTRARVTNLLLRKLKKLHDERRRLMIQRRQDATFQKDGQSFVNTFLQSNDNHSQTVDTYQGICNILEFIVQNCSLPDDEKDRLKKSLQFYKSPDVSSYSYGNFCRYGFF